MNHCCMPFENIEMNIDGSVYTCCPNWINQYSIGNMYEKSIAEIWNDQKIKELRKRVLNNDYSLCSKEICFNLSNKFYQSSIEDRDIKVHMDKMPTYIKLAYDRECNIACRICREDVTKSTPEELKKLDNIFETKILPCLKDAKRITINATGDPFGSRHSIKVIKRISKEYPKIRFDINTNGLLCTKKILKNFGIIDKMDILRITVSATTKETYSKMVKNGEKYFDLLCSNLEEMKDLKKEKNFEFYLHFVVTSQNYKEMVDFINFSKYYTAIPSLWEFRSESIVYPKNVDKTWAITFPEHKEHKELLKYLKNDVFKNYEFSLSPILLNLRKQALL